MDEKELFLKSYKSGYTIKEIAKMYGLSTTRVRMTILDNLEVNSGQSRFSKEERKQIADAYMSGTMTQKQIAYRWGCGYSTVRNYVIEFYGTDFKTILNKNKDGNNLPRRPSKLELVEAVKQSKDKTAGELAQMLGVSTETIYKYAKLSNTIVPTGRCIVCGTLVTNNRKSCSIECKALVQRASKYKIDVSVILSAKACAICGKETTLHVDHDHVTEEFRGMICKPCNTLIGQFKNDPDIIRNAIDYLLKW